MAHVSKKAEKVLIHLARQIAGKEKEQLYVVSVKTGKVVAHFKGNEKAVRKDAETTLLLRKNGQKYVVLHNHPGGKAPSIGDVINALRSAYAESWVVTPKGKIWRFKSLSSKPMSKEQVATLRRYKDVARGTIRRRAKKDIKGQTKKEKSVAIAERRKATNRLMMQFLAKGIHLPPVLTYTVTRANPSEPCCFCTRGTYCQ
jgi:hypothetical protein